MLCALLSAHQARKTPTCLQCGQHLAAATTLTRKQRCAVPVCVGHGRSASFSVCRLCSPHHTCVCLVGGDGCAVHRPRTSRPLLAVVHPTFCQCSHQHQASPDCCCCLLQVIDPKEAARKKAEESRAATAAAKLQKQAAGSKKISSFFAAAKKPK